MLDWFDRKKESARERACWRLWDGCSALSGFPSAKPHASYFFIAMREKLYSKLERTPSNDMGGT